MSNKKTTKKEVGTKSSSPVKKKDSSEHNILFNFLMGHKDGKDEHKKKFREQLKQELEKVMSEHSCRDKYNILVLFDPGTMIKSDADQIYSAITAFEKENNKATLLILTSNGGDPRSAYLIGKLCRELSADKEFIVAIPRNAKSAATLLASAADEIHMGSLSELGPIDPQINGLPALGLKSAIETIADIVDKNEGSAELFARYLHRTVPPVEIGYYGRAAESAKQYAIRLMKARKKKPVPDLEKVAHKLVHEYKDHGFVIDKTEATEIFGQDMIKVDTEEYDLANDIYTVLSRIERFAGRTNCYFGLIGTYDSEPIAFTKNDEV